MMQLKRAFLVFFLFFTAVVPAVSQEAKAGEGSHIKATFENSSRFQVQVHILAYGAIASSYTLEPYQNMEVDVEYGHGILLEYPTPPHRTELSPLGSLNELYRRIYLRNDGDNLFIEEKISGQRVKGKGEKRALKSTISDPGMQSHRKTDMVQPENKDKPTAIDDYQQQQKNKDKKKPKEEPAQPENKTEKEKKKK